MLKQKTIAIVVPAYNEESQIPTVLKTLPQYVDNIVVVNDGSRDRTSAVVSKAKKKDKRIVLLIHKRNQGVGASVATGYKWCDRKNVDIAVVMDGDGQMSPNDLKKIITPVAENIADYSKANRLLSGKAYSIIPKGRYFGNAMLSFLTKIASGYWHVMDSQSGYKAINKKMLNLIDWSKLYKRYGYPNDALTKLNVYNARVIDVPIEPVYNIGEKSGMKLSVMLIRMPFLLLSLFFWRLREKYIIRDFHPLILFYFFGLFSLLSAVILLIREIVMLANTGEFFKINFLAFMLCSLMAVQFTLFAMWFDMEYNKDLCIKQFDKK